MDPRHPEQAVSRMMELMKQFMGVQEKMNYTQSSSGLAELEREGSLVVQEICLVAPRLHEAMIQTSRQRRHDLAHDVLDEPQDTAVELGIRTKYEQPFEPVENSVEKCDAPEEIPTLPNQAETVIVEPKPRKKTTKKKAKK